MTMTKYYTIHNIAFIYTFFTLNVYSAQFVSLCLHTNSSEILCILPALHCMACIKLSKQMCLWEMGCLINLWHNVIELVGT